MDAVRKIVGVIFIAIAAIVAIHAILEPLYHTPSPEQPYSPLWDILDPIMALAVIVGVVLAFLRKRAVDEEGGMTWDRIAASTLFYGFIFIGILFFWNWFNILGTGLNTANTDAVAVIWIVIDAALPILTGSLGMRLFKGAGG